MTDTENTYIRRVLDTELDQLHAGGAAAVALEGAKGVGKSATASQRATTRFLLEDPAVRQILAASPELLTQGVPALIDEWQHLPVTWDIVRRAVDAGATAGSFYLTGSASGPNSGTHSGAGRILNVRMRTLSLAERELGAPSVSLSALLTGARPKITGQTDITLGEYVDEIVASGFPGIRPLDARVKRAQLRGYVDRVIDRDFVEMGRSVRNPSALRRWLTAYAAATATTASYETIRDAATAGQNDKPSRGSTGPYLDTLERLYVIEPMPAWLPTRNHIAELAAAPKHHLIDVALATSLLGLGRDALLRGETISVAVPRDGTLLGSLFESLVAASVRVYAQAAEARVAHFRTHRGEHEVDLIIERDDGRVVALETKIAQSIDDDDVKHLTWLRNRLGEDLLDAAVITTGTHAYRRPDGIAVIPAVLLGV